MFSNRNTILLKFKVKMLTQRPKFNFFSNVTYQRLKSSFFCSKSQKKDNTLNKETLIKYYIISVIYPVDVYLFKGNIKNIRKRCEICSKLTVKAPERRNWSPSGVFIVNLQHISHVLLVFLLLNLNNKMLAG